MNFKKILVIVIALVFVGIGVFLIIRGNELAKRCTEEAVGTVVEIKMEESLESDEYGTHTIYTYYPIIEYKAGDKTVTKQSENGASGQSAYKLNDKIDILYNPQNVEEFIVKGDNSSNFMGIIFIVAGVLALGVGIFAKIQ